MVEVADEETITRLELPRPRDALHRAEHEIELRPIRAEQHDRIAVMHEQIVFSIPIEVAGVTIKEAVPADGMHERLELGVTHGTIRRRVAAHPAIDDRTIDAAVVVAAAFEQPYVLVIAPPSRLRALIKSGAVPGAWGRIDAGRDRRGGIDEPSPFERGAVGVLGEIHRARLGTRVRAGLAVLVGQPAGAVSEFVRHDRPVRPQRDDLKPASAAPAEAGLIQDDQDQVIVRHPGVERVLDERACVCAVLQPAMCPRPAEDVAEGRVLQRGADDRVVAAIRRRAMLIVHSLAHAGFIRVQVDSKYIECLSILIEVVVAKDAVEQEFLHLIVVERLIASREAVAQHCNIFLHARRAGLENLGHAIWHNSLFIYPPTAAEVVWQ